MDATPLVSVCVPLYNKAAHVERCVRTILACPQERMEVVIFDNGSSDGSSEIARRLAADDSRIRYIRLDYTITIQESWRMALLHSRGDFLKIQSADDEFQPDFFTHMLPPLLASNGPDFTLCAEVVERRGVEYHPSLPGLWNDNCRRIVSMENKPDRARELFRACSVANGLGNLFKILFHRRCLPMERWRTMTLGFGMPQSYPDWDFLIRLLLNYRGLYIDRPLSKFVVMPESPCIRHATDPLLRMADGSQLVIMMMTMLTDPTLHDLRSAVAPQQLQEIYNHAFYRLRDITQLALSLPPPSA